MRTIAITAGIAMAALFLSVSLPSAKIDALLLGDANCDTRVDAVDAMFILQFQAGLLPSVPCALAADVNLDQRVNPLDATLILQYGAGLIFRLPPLSVTPRPTFTPTSSPLLSRAEASALASEWLMNNPPDVGIYVKYVRYASCEATWRGNTYWFVVCEARIHLITTLGHFPLWFPLSACVFDRTGIVAPTCL